MFYRLIISTVVFLAGCSSTPLGSFNYGSNRAVLSFTANRYLELEPCGCKVRNLGGIHRESVLYQQWDQRLGTQRLSFTAGTSFVPLPTNYKTSRLSTYRLKAQSMIDALNEIGMHYISPTAEDLSLGTAAILALEKSTNGHFVSSNLYSVKTKRPIFKPIVQTKIESTPVLILGLSDLPDARYKKNTDLKILDPIEAVRRALKGQDTKGRLLIVLSNLSNRQQNRVAKAFPDIQIFGGGPENQHFTDAKQLDFNTLYLNPEHLGKAVTFLEMGWDEKVDTFFDPRMIDQAKSKVARIQRRLASTNREIQNLKGKKNRIDRSRRDFLSKGKARQKKNLATAEEISNLPKVGIRYHTTSEVTGENYESINNVFHIVSRYKKKLRQQALEQ